MELTLIFYAIQIAKSFYDHGRFDVFKRRFPSIFCGKIPSMSFRNWLWISSPNFIVSTRSWTMNMIYPPIIIIFRLKT